jgi:HEAT repeat protein
MQTIQPILLGLGLIFGPAPDRNSTSVSPRIGLGWVRSETDPRDLDLAHLREVLHDRLDPLGQSQAALILVQSDDPDAEKMVRQGLHQHEETEVFLALCAAVRLRHDRRFLDELLKALRANKPRIRQAIAETLAVLPDPNLVRRLQAVVADTRAELPVRQTALWALGRCGRKQAAEVLVEQLSSDNEDLRRVACAALADLTGQTPDRDVAHWRTWWARHKHLTSEQWLEMRLSLQTSRAQRLDGELTRARIQVLRLQQQLYNRLPVADRFTHIQSLLDQDDPAVRGLAVVWSLELLPAADPTRQHLLAQVLLRLSHDGNTDVQRAAVLGLGRVREQAVWDRLRALLKAEQPAVRASAVRALARQARGTEREARARQKEVIPALQKALEDKSAGVVVEAAEALGVLGDPEAGPILIGLLRHPAQHVRQTAAQALERVANPNVMEGLLKGLDDTSVTVRFSLVGAVGRAAGDGRGLPEEQRKRVLARLEKLLCGDADPGVRSRAATVLGECAAPGLLEPLWRSAQSSTPGRVQEKAWDAFVEIIARSGNLSLLQQWERTVKEAHQETRRLHLLTVVAARWQQVAETKALAVRVQESLVQAQLDQGKWSAAAPVVRELLAQASSETQLSQRLNWQLQIGEQALREGNRAEALRAVKEAQAYLPRARKLAEAFEKLEKRAGREE